MVERFFVVEVFVEVFKDVVVEFVVEVFIEVFKEVVVEFVVVVVRFFFEIVEKVE